MSEFIGLFTGSIWPWLIGVVGIFLGGAILKVKHSNKKEAEATERAEESERQVQEAQSVATAQQRAQEAINKVRAKSKPRPAKKTPGAFETKR